jgi:hypothetical protein
MGILSNPPLLLWRTVGDRFNGKRGVSDPVILGLQFVGAKESELPGVNGFLARPAVFKVRGKAARQFLRILRPGSAQARENANGWRSPGPPRRKLWRFPMKNQTLMAKTQNVDGLRELTSSQLAEVTGGSLSVVSYDDYCGNGLPRPPHFQLVTSSLNAVNPAGIQQFGMRQG